MKSAVILAIALSSWLPTKSLTPGATNRAVTPANIKTTICRNGGYTKSIRPPPKYTDALKRRQLKQPRYANDRKPRDYEEDHLISLEIGGDPKSPRNLWPEPYRGKCGAHVKDKLEDRLHKLVCTGKITLKDAQHTISTDWVAGYNKYVGKLSCK